jgi:hypothetical protein
VDRHGINSPVYAALPGLKPADWTGLRSACAKYFTGVLDDWDPAGEDRPEERPRR